MFRNVVVKGLQYNVYCVRTIFDGLQYIGAWAPLYWSHYVGAPSVQQTCFFVLFLNMKHGKQNVSSPLVGPSCDTQNLVLSELSLLNPSQNLENKI